jgi:hypothetical protein
VEAGQPAQLTGTNRSIGLSASAPSGKCHESPTWARPGRCSNCTPVGLQPPDLIRGEGRGPCRAAALSSKDTERHSTHTTRFRPPARGPVAADLSSAVQMGPGLRRGARSANRAPPARGASRRFGRPGGHSEGQNTRSHPELGRENPQRRWYCASRRGRVGRRQTRQTAKPKPTHHIIRLTRGGAAR